MALLAWLANLGSSFKSNVKPPRNVEDVADAVRYACTFAINTVTSLIKDTVDVQVYERWHQAQL